MVDWWYIIVFLVSGLLIGIVYLHSYGLISYIRKMDEEDEVCDTCQNKKDCIAIKPIGNSNWVTEFTYTTYGLVRKNCMYTREKNLRYMLILAVLNGICYVPLYLIYGMSLEAVLYCLCTTALLYVGVVDWNTQYIPAEFNIFIFVLGLIRLCFRLDNWKEQVVGLFAVSVFLLIVDFLGSKLREGEHIVGGGDIKLMAAAGLLLGWKLNIVAFMMGCICGSIIHLVIMKIGKGGHRLAFGPYLAMGVYIAMICGEQLVSWYLGIMGL